MNNEFDVDVDVDVDVHISNIAEDFSDTHVCFRPRVSYLTTFDYYTQIYIFLIIPCI